MLASEPADVVVVGAGAAGLAAAIFAAEAAPQRRIVVLERCASIGAKILISGGGRCNVTNARVRPHDFNGAQTIIRNVLAGFDEKAALRWFATLGVELKEEPHGKLFPTSDRARTVLDALLTRCRDLAIPILCHQRVDDIRLDDGLVVCAERFQLRAARVVLASGGRSLPRTGSDGVGWEIVRRLGHSVTETYPALVPLLLKPGFFHAALTGVSLVAELSTFAGGKRQDRRSGSLLFTHFGISGPVALAASRHWLAANAAGRGAELRCNFLAGESFEGAENRLLEASAAHPHKSLSRWLGEILPERLAVALLEHAGIDPAIPLTQLLRAQRRSLAHALVELPLPVTGARGWDFAEVTAGGVPLSEVNFRTMESRRQPGLYLIGELLDCDGRIGGFNFQWAWATGHLAGIAAARSLES